MKNTFLNIAVVTFLKEHFKYLTKYGRNKIVVYCCDLHVKTCCSQGDRYISENAVTYVILSSSIFHCFHYANEDSNKFTHSDTFEMNNNKSGKGVIHYAIFIVSNGRVFSLLSLLSAG
jgi:hypothetical protein